MKKLKSMALPKLLMMLMLATLVLAGCGKIKEVPTEDTYFYVNPDETKAQTDAGFVIDGVLDEEAYKNNNWLYLHNDDVGNHVNIAMTSYYGEKGMYFVYDVTESVPIYVNLDRNPVLNSCIEMYLAPPYLTSDRDNSLFEIDLMPTGDMSFRKSNGAYGFNNVVASNDKMAVLGATTKGGEVNTPECYGYCLELFIPWEYMTWLDIDADAMRNGHVYVNPAHITSNNFEGTDINLDRYWYFYAQQNGADFGDVNQFFRFDANGVIGTKPVKAEGMENCTVSYNDSVLPGMKTLFTVTPNSGYSITSIVVNGEEMISEVSYNKDGSVTMEARSNMDGITISAKAEKTEEGNKTLSGQIIVNDTFGGKLEGIVASYVGPTGEKPLAFDKDGKFEIKDLAQDYYAISVSKEGYFTVNRNIYLDKDTYTQLILEYDTFVNGKGLCWIFDKQNDGVIQKLGGTGHFISNKSYHSFTVSANLKYDPELAAQGTSDHYTQQRSGIRMQFSNGKVWHVDILKEKDQYILQYAKMSGDNSLTGWKNVHTLSGYEVKQYMSEDGINLRIMRQGKLMAVWLGNTLLVIEDFGDKMQSCSAQIGLEAWIANQGVMEIPFTVSAGVPVDVAGSPFHWPADIWDISGQYKGTITKFPAPGKDTWLDTKIDCNDVTTICKDLSPENKDYCMIYIFKFSNGENFRLRLNHTDNDDKFRIQSFAGSTLSPAWKNYYTLTDEQAQKALTDGVSYRVQILDTTAYVFIDGKQVCTVDLSTNVNTGEPSGVENATVRVSFRMDGNTVGNAVIPFKLENNSKNVKLNIAETQNGTITAEKTSYKVGDTIKLTVTGNDGYYAKLSVDGTPVMLNWDGTYSFTAEKKVYNITGEFTPGILAENSQSAWNLLNQNMGVLLMESHESGNSGTISSTGVANDVSAVVKDLNPDAKDFSMIYDFAFSNGERFVVRLNHTDADGKYRIQSMSGSTLFAPWKNAYALTDEQAAKAQSEGIEFQVEIYGTTAYVRLDGAEVCTYDLSKVEATGKPSGIENADVFVSIRMDGNLGQDVEIPFAMKDTSKTIELNIADMAGGTVVADKLSYVRGETVTLTVTPNNGYSQKLYINGEALLLDWKTNQYRFVATERTYTITGSFEPSLEEAPSDAARWDSSNQAHGVISTYYPNNNDSWWYKINGGYDFLAVDAKNYLPMADSAEGGGTTGFSMVLAVSLDNGKTYGFRILNEKENGNGAARYIYTRYGASGCVTGWGGWCQLEAKAPGVTEKLQGDGAEFKLTRTGANTLQITLDGVVLDTYTMDGVTSANKVTSFGIYHYGNKGQKVQIPFAVTNNSDAAPVTITIPTLANGTVTTDKQSYRVGDTVTLIVVPKAGYSQKVTVDGEPVLLDWKSNSYSFVAKKDSYVVSGSFVPSLQENPSDAVRWDSSNQAHGVITTYYPNNNDSWWYKINGNYNSFAVNAKNYLPMADSAEGGGKVGYAFTLAITLDNGKSYGFRFINERENGNGDPRYVYTRFGASGCVTGWGGWCALESKIPGITEKLQGDGAEFKLTRTDANTLQITLDGVVLDTYTMDGVTAANKVTSVGIYHYGNKGQMVEIPFVLTPAPDSKELG